MAKWGKGDPRWIVEERADATNVNNWHWTEKNATPWSRDKIKELLSGLKIENEEFSCKIKEISKIEGEATANNRKAKLIFFYEWVINGDWEGTLKNSENKTVYKGKFDIPNLSEEHDAKDVDVNITMTNDNKQPKLKEFMYRQGTEKIREQLAKYITLLKEEFSQGLILPTKDSSSNLKNLASTQANLQGPKSTEKSASEKLNQEINGSVKILTKKLSLNEDFKCRVNELYDVFTNIEMVRAFGRSSNIVYEPEKGGKFSLFDSNVTGSFVELVPNKKIVMNWKNKRWADDHYSVVTLEFNEKEDY
ncbi:activator of 90 kDa heat shock ATPase -like protein, partial [Brachionus plicatilis]